jgi:tRNA-intron endonuclease
MDIFGELVGDCVIIKKPKDVGRLYTKSHFGTPLSGNEIRLDLIEAVFLLDEGKLRLFQNNTQVDFQHLVVLAAQKVPEFETKYLVFKDLRNHGHAIKLCDAESVAMFQQFKQKKEDSPSCFIVAFSERDILDIDATKQLIRKVTKKNDALWFALVDEEGDLTYYDVSAVDLKGDVPTTEFSKGTCLLLKNRLILFERKLANQLLQKEFFGKPFGDGLQLSFVEGLYLLENNVLEIWTSDGKKLSKEKCITMMKILQPDIEQRLTVFRDLKQRGLLIKTGFKFGAHFRAYTTQPDKTHAEYLIHVVEMGFRSIWAEISRAVRLAHSVNKEFVFARVDGSTIDYIKLGRLRP